MAGMFGRVDFSIEKKCVIVMCADNGVVAEGISQSGQEVTAIVAENLTSASRFL
jgi:nicotinate-nucleotide--dimethylbenzimidazole phosphoribosyltransferase